MQVRTMPLLEFAKAPGRTFSIPLFQRPYSWEGWQCQVLWQDLLRTAESGRPHFFGAVFYRDEPDRNGNPSLALIDGQQRMLTTLLLVSALADEARRCGGMIDGRDVGEVARDYLLAEGHPRAVPAQRDEAAFAEALSTPADDLPDQAPHPLANKALFAQALRDGALSSQGAWDALARFQIVAIGLEDAEDAQAIFESFNSKGVPLVAADMVRNYLLLSEEPEEQARLYNQYWEPIQGLFGDDPGSLRLNNALRAWTVIRCKTPRARSDAEAFDDFKQYAQNEYEGDKEDLMAELLSFCAVWAENYRYHAVKRFRSAQWSSIGRKTLVSDRPLAQASSQVRAFYEQHYGVEAKEDEGR